METAMQELIEWTIKNAFNITGQDGVAYVVIDHEEMRLHFDRLLAKEKKQIINAYTHKRILRPTLERMKITVGKAKQYYNEKFITPTN